MRNIASTGIFLSIKKHFVSLTLLAILLFVGLIDGVPFAVSDGYGYYHTAKQLATNYSFISDTKPDYFYYSKHGVDFYHGKYVNRYSPGNSLLWFPSLSVSSRFDKGTVSDNYYKGFNGHSLSDGIAVLLTSIVLFYLTIIITYKILQELKIGRSISYFSIIVGTLGLGIIPYVYEYPFFSHVNEAFALSGLILYFIRVTKGNQKLKNYLLLGLFSGLLVLIRPTNAIFVVLLLIVQILIRTSLKNLFFIVISGLPFLVIFLIYNKISYGSLFTTGYSAIVAQSFNFSDMFLYEELFSSIRGWFIYTPLAVMGILGLIIWMIEHYRKPHLTGLIGLYSIISVLLLILLYSFWPAWWGGDSIGNRFFIVNFVLIIIGIAKLLTALQHTRVLRPAVIVLLLFSLYSFGLMTLMRITPLSSLNSPNIHEKRIDNRYSYIPETERYSPLMIFRYHVNLFNNRESINDYTQKLKSSLYGGRSILLLILGQTDPLLNVEKVDDTSYIVHFIPNNVSSTRSANLSIFVHTKGRICEIPIYKDFSSYSNSKLVIEENECLYENNRYAIQERPFEGLELVNIGKYDFAFSSSDPLKFIDYKTGSTD